MKKDKIKQVKEIARKMYPMQRMKPRVIEKGRKKARVNEKVSIRKELQELEDAELL